MAQFIAGLRDQPSEEAFSPIALRNLQESLLLEHETKNKAARKVLANNAKKIRNGLQNKRKQIKEDAIQALKNNLGICLSRFRSSIRAELEQECLGLALQITESFIGKLATSDKRLLQKGLRSAFEEAQEETNIQIAFHPSDREHLQNLITASGNSEYKLLADPEMQQGKAKIIAGKRRFVIDWEEQFERISRDILLEYSAKSTHHEHQSH
jgi:predicted Ser/Thr protein kinase